MSHRYKQKHILEILRNEGCTKLARHLKNSKAIGSHQRDSSRLFLTTRRYWDFVYALQKKNFRGKPLNDIGPAILQLAREHNVDIESELLPLAQLLSEGKL